MATSGRRLAAINQLAAFVLGMTERRFKPHLQHDVPHRVEPNNFFHLCLRVAREQKMLLTDPNLAEALLESARFYHKGRWWLGVFVLMPDHLHALAAFPRQEDMSKVVGDWKRWQHTRHQVFWQDGYFDHRVREDERGTQIQNQADYLRNIRSGRGFVSDRKTGLGSRSISRRFLHLEASDGARRSPSTSPFLNVL